MSRSTKSVLKGFDRQNMGYPVTSQSTISQTRMYIDSDKTEEWMNFRYQGMTLPGISDPHGWCLEWAWEGCMHSRDHPGNKIYVRRFQRSCCRSICSSCFPKWIDRESEAIRNRIERGVSKTRLKPIHVMISVPAWDYGLDIKKLRSKALVISKQVGLKGGCLFFHPARFDHRDGSKVVPYTSPHFHVIGFGWIKDTEILYKKQGYVVKNLGVRKTMGEVFGTVQYELTHVGIQKGRHAVTWFGSLAYSKLKIVKKDYKRKCPECRRRLQRIDYTLKSWKLLDGQAPEGVYEGLVDPVGWERASTVVVNDVRR